AQLVLSTSFLLLGCWCIEDFFLVPSHPCLRIRFGTLLRREAAMRACCPGLTRTGREDVNLVAFHDSSLILKKSCPCITNAPRAPGSRRRSTEVAHAARSSGCAARPRDARPTRMAS